MTHVSFNYLVFIIPMMFSCLVAFEDHKVPSIVINCSHDDHCADFRMSCLQNLCICSRFYDWDEELKQCHLNLQELGIWLSNLKEERDLRGEMNAKTKAVFFNLGLAGVSAILLGVCGGLVCVYFFCFQRQVVLFQSYIAKNTIIVFHHKQCSFKQWCQTYEMSSINIEHKALVVGSMDDIESRLIILKRRAAEADFLREERDMLLNRLKLYNPDFILPEPGLKMQIGFDYDNLIKENESFQTENNELKLKIEALDSYIKELQEIKGKADVLLQENSELRENLNTLRPLEKDLEVLVVERNQLEKEFNSLLEIKGSNDPEAKYKLYIKRLCNQYNSVLQEKEQLQDCLTAKEVRIQVFTSKISHLNTIIDDKYLRAKSKAARGEDLDDEEALLLTVRELEKANKKMGEELVYLNSKFNDLAQKYREENLVVAQKLLLKKIPECQTTHKMEASNVTRMFNQEDDKGSTGQPSFSISMCSLLEEYQPEFMSKRLQQLYYNTKELTNYNMKMYPLRAYIEKTKSSLNPWTEPSFHTVTMASETTQ